MNSKTNITILHHLKNIFLLSISIVASRAGAQVLLIVNLAAVGKVGAFQLSSFGLATTPFFTLTLIGITLASMLSVEVSRALAIKDKQRIAQQTVGGAYLWVIFSSLIALICVVLGFQKSNSDLTSRANLVLLALAFGAPAYLGYFYVSNIMEGLKKSKDAAVVTVIAIFLNAAFDVFLVNRFSDLKYFSVLVASVMVAIRWAMFLALLWRMKVALEKNEIRLGSVAFDTAWTTILAQLKFGAPVAISMGMRSAAVSALTLVAVKLGSIEVGVFAVAANLIGLNNMVANGISNAALVQISHYRGLERVSDIQRCSFASVSLAGLVAMFVSLAMVLFQDRVLGFFSSDPNVLTRLNDSVFYLLLFFSVDCFCTVLVGNLRPLGDRWIPQAGFGFLLFVLGVPAGYLLTTTSDLGISGLFAGMAFSYLSGAVFIAYRVLRNPMLFRAA